MGDDKSKKPLGGQISNPTTKEGNRISDILSASERSSLKLHRKMLS